MGQRLITEAIDGINALIEASYSVEGITYYNLAKRIPKNEGIAVIARDGRNISGSLVELKKSNKGVIYHRIIEQKKDKTPGKGRDSVLTIRTTLRLVAWIKRPQGSVARKDWDDQELMNECAQIVNSNSWADKSEIAKVTSNSSDYLGILEEEIGIVDKNKKLPYELTLFTIDYEVVQKQKCSYKTGQTVTAITSLIVTPSDQEGTSGPISDINITTDQPANISIPNLPSNLNLTQLSNTQWKITGTFSGSAQQFGVIAQGIAGGLLEQCVDITIPSSSTPVTGLSYTNDDQTIWQNTGSTGVFTTMEAQPTPSNATGTYSSIDLPDGLSLNSSTGEITVSDFSLIPSGASNFTVTFTGSGSFTGSANANLSVTKNTLWNPLNLTDAATRVIGFFDFSDNGNLTIVDNAIQGVEDRSAGGNDISQTSNTSFIGSINGVRAAVFINTNYLVNLGVSSSNFNLFYKTNQAPGTGEFVVSRSNADYVIRCNTVAEGRFDQRVSSGTSTTFSFPSGATGNEQKGKVFGDNFYTLNIYYSGGSTTRLRIDGGESYDSGDISGGTLPFDFGTDFFIGSRGTPVGQFSAGSFGYFLFINDSLTTDERQRIEGWDAHLYSTTDKLAGGHPYKSLPPFV